MANPPLSLIMTTYNHAAFVAEAVLGALDQRYSPLEIVISDDASTDDTWTVVQELVGRYRGPHTVRLHRHPTNIGPGLNTFHAVQMATGRFHIRAHGDDISLPDRVQKVAALWRRTRATLITHNAIRASGLRDRGGLVQPPSRTTEMTLDYIASRSWTQQMLGATFSWDPRLFKVFGSFDRTLLPRGGDHVLPLRAAMLTSAWYLDEPLVLWRSHPGQMTLRTADFDGTPDMAAETMTAYDLTAQLQRLRDVRAFRQARDSRALAQAEQQIVQVIYALGSRWSAHRSTLEGAGLTLAWLARGAPAGARPPSPHPAQASEIRQASRLQELVAEVGRLAAGPAGPDKTAAVTRAVSGLLETMNRWVLQRNLLHNAGLKPRWGPTPPA